MMNKLKIPKIMNKITIGARAATATIMSSRGLLGLLIDIAVIVVSYFVIKGIAIQLL
jgi:hypothetical protein